MEGGGAPETLDDGLLKRVTTRYALYIYHGVAANQAFLAIVEGAPEPRLDPVDVGHQVMALEARQMVVLLAVRSGALGQLVRILVFEQFIRLPLFVVPVLIY